MTNNAGSFAGPAPPEDEYEAPSDEDDEGSDDTPIEEKGLDIRPDSPGWEDVEADTEDLSVQCLLCPQQFSTSPLMLGHCEDSHNFDFVSVVKQHGLDFYGTIKYINLIRLRVQESMPDPQELDTAALESDDRAKPTMENDALLFSLDDVIDFESTDQPDEVMSNGHG